MTCSVKTRGAFTICRFEIPLDSCFEDPLPLIGARLFEIKRSSLFGDRFGVPSTMAGIAFGVLLTIPLAILLNPILARVQAR